LIIGNPRRKFGGLRCRHFRKKDKPRTAVLHAALFGWLETGGSFFAVADRHGPLRRDALLDEEILSHLSALGAESEIVFGRADVVAVSLDFDARSWIAFHPFGVALENLLRVASQIDAIELVIDVFQGRARRRYGGNAAADRFHGRR